MASVVVTPTALDDLDGLIRTHSPPDDTRSRLQRSLQPLARFPYLGAPLGGRWSAYRFILGPWRWMIVVYEYHENTDRVAIVTMQDARSAVSPTSELS